MTIGEKKLGLSGEDETPTNRIDNEKVKFAKKYITEELGVNGKKVKYKDTLSGR